MKYLYLILSLLGLLGCPTTPEEAEPQLKKYWQMELGINGEAPPVVKGDSIFFTAHPYLYAMSTKDSIVYWNTVLDQSKRFQGDILLVSKDQIVLSQLNIVKAFDRSNGTLLWEYDPEEIFRIVPLGNHTIYEKGYIFTAYNRRVAGISNLGDLEFMSQLDSGFTVHGVLYNDGELFINRVNTVHGGLTQGMILVQDFSEGGELWKYETDDGGFYEQPVIEGDILYAATRGNSPNKEVIALSKNTGELLWKTTIEIGAQKILVTPDHVIINIGSRMQAFLKSDGMKEWEFEWESSASLFQPVYLGGYIYISNHYQLFVIESKTGELVHTEPLPEGGSYFWHLAVSEDKLFAQTSYQLIAYQPWHLRED
ncbi:MAG: PQQ-binding-like beta-propeller repeat protein [Balneola sp.]